MTDFAIEESIRTSSVARFICGIDEVGRGALFGPVVAAGVILDPRKIPKGLTDSKRLSHKQRVVWSEWIYNHALACGLSWIWNEEIDEINILQATRMAMAGAVKNLAFIPDHLLIDGPIKLDLDIPQTQIIKGDQKSLSIAAASVIAKVFRDTLMEQMAHFFPLLGLEKNKGYPTKKHRSMLSCCGLSTFHRMSFRKG